jgi:hypothetical protein
MSSIINKKSQYTIDSHNNFFIGQYKQIKKKNLVRNIGLFVCLFIQKIHTIKYLGMS